MCSANRLIEAPTAMPDFIGRQPEIAQLKALTKLRTASLVVIKGRRRVGKSRLATEFATRQPGYRLVTLIGLAPDDETTAQSEREDFAQQLSRELKIPPPRADDWNTLLWELGERTRTGKWIVLLDEINWMGSLDPTFLPKLKAAWDLYFARNDKLMLILSGSLAGWIDRNILHSTGFVGRVHLEIKLDELPLSQCAPFLAGGHGHISHYERFKIVSVTGGIPSYLERIDPSTSADANIQRLCFEKGAYLVREFEVLFHDLFKKKRFYRQLIAAVAETPLTLEALYRKLKLQKSGYISEAVDELTQAGFLERHHTWNVKEKAESKLSRIRVIDNYTRFYFRCIKPNMAAIERNAGHLPANLDGVLGLQFENIILKNRAAVWEELGIRAEDIVFDNPYWQTRTQKTQGCQIDYMIQCRNNNVYVCEIKLAKEPLPKSVIAEVKEKIDCLVKPDNFTFRPVLIHVNGVDPSVSETGYFDSIIDFGQLWR